MFPSFLLLDLAVLLLLALCAWRGAVKGLILSLCGLLAAVLAFFGAMWISDQFSEPVAEFIEPYISGYVETALDEFEDRLGLDSTPDSAPDSAPTPSFPIPSDGAEEIPVDPQFTLNEVLNALQESERFTGLIQSLYDAVDLGSLVVTGSAVAAVAGFLSLRLARAGLFLASFLLILILWWLISHVLDLAFKLPVLRTFNKAGGLLLGLIKGALILLVACWAIRIFDLLPAELTEQTKLFLYFMNFQLF